MWSILRCIYINKKDCAHCTNISVKAQLFDALKSQGVIYLSWPSMTSYCHSTKDWVWNTILHDFEPLWVCYCYITNNFNTWTKPRSWRPICLKWVTWFHGATVWYKIETVLTKICADPKVENCLLHYSTATIERKPLLLKPGFFSVNLVFTDHRSDYLLTLGIGIAWLIVSSSATCKVNVKL